MKKATYIGSALLTAAFLMTAGSALAQTANGVTTTFDSAVDAPSAGVDAQALGTVTLSASGNGPFTVESLPIMLTTSSSAAAASLSNCQLTNGTGVALNTGAHAGSLANGTSVITFDNPLSVSTSVPTTLTLRCDVASNLPSGATFSFGVGQANLTSANDSTNTTTNTNNTTSTNSGLSVSLSTAPSVPAGSSRVVLATALVQAGSSGPVSLSSLPITASFTNGGTIQNFTACSVQNAAALGVPLSAPMMLSNGGATSFTLMVPTLIAANSVQRLAIVCDVAPTAPAGSMVSFAIDPTALSATMNGSDMTAVSSGTTSGTVTITPALAGSTGTTNGSTPGVPNTGVGGDALATLLILALSLFAAFIGATVSRKAKGGNTQVNA